MRRDLLSFFFSLASSKGEFWAEEARQEPNKKLYNNYQSEPYLATSIKVRVDSFFMIPEDAHHLLLNLRLLVSIKIIFKYNIHF